MAGYVYALELKDKSSLYCYVGATQNINKRLYEHLHGIGSNITKQFGIERILLIDTYGSVHDALLTESLMHSNQRKDRQWKPEICNCEHLDLTQIASYLRIISVFHV